MKKRFGGGALAIIVVLCALAGAGLVPIGVWAHDRFVDVPDSNVHHANIGAIADAGITAGCSTGNYCPATEVRRDQMASFLARTAGLNTGRVVMHGNGDLRAYCDRAKQFPSTFDFEPCNNWNTFDAGADVTQVSMALGADGRPIIAYYDANAGSLKTAQCKDRRCARAQVSSLATGFQGQYPSIAVGRDGVPVVSYWDFLNFDLRIARCTTKACTAATSIALDSTGTVGAHSSLAIGSDGIPVVSYFDGTNEDLKLVRCTDERCTAPRTPVVLDSVGKVGEATDIAISAAGNPIVVYRDATNNQLKIAHCEAVSCGSALRTAYPDPFDADLMGLQNSLTIGTTGLPLIATMRSKVQNGDTFYLPLVVRCPTVDCAGVQSSDLTAVEGFVSFAFTYVDIAVGLDGRAVVSGGYDSARCVDVACTAMEPHARIENVRPASVIVGADGAPLAAFGTPDGLRVARVEALPV